MAKVFENCSGLAMRPEQRKLTALETESLCAPFQCNVDPLKNTFWILPWSVWWPAAALSLAQLREAIRTAKVFGNRSGSAMHRILFHCLLKPGEILWLCATFQRNTRLFETFWILPWSVRWLASSLSQLWPWEPIRMVKSFTNFVAQPCSPGILFNCL
jgi:hypothetical protein